MLRTFGFAVVALLVCFPPSRLSYHDEDWFDFMKLNCGMFYYESDGPSWSPLLGTDLGSGELVQGLNAETNIKNGFWLGKISLWQILRDRCKPIVYRYAIYISYTLSPNTLIVAELENDGKTIKTTYQRRSECEKSKKEKFGVNYSYKQSYFCRVIARPASSS